MFKIITKFSLSILLLAASANAGASDAFPMIETLNPEEGSLSFIDANGKTRTMQIVALRKDCIPPACLDFPEPKPEPAPPREWNLPGVGPVLGVGTSSVQGVHGNLGVIIGPGECSSSDGGPFFGPGSYCNNAGVLIEFTPGHAANAASIGIGAKVLALGGIDFEAGADVKVSYLWMDSSGVHGTYYPESMAFIGPQVDASFMFLKLSLGLLKKVAGNDPAYNWLWNAGIGFTI